MDQVCRKMLLKPIHFVSQNSTRRCRAVPVGVRETMSFVFSVTDIVSDSNMNNLGTLVIPEFVFGLIQCVALSIVDCHRPLHFRRVIKFSITL